VFFAYITDLILQMAHQSDHRNLSDVACIALLAIALYGQYILCGGLLKDDLSFVNVPQHYDSYIQFQGFMSSFQTGAARIC
jgi:hypothetical protein